MKSTLVTMLRWTSTKLAVAADKIEASTVIKDAAVKAKSFVKKTWATVKLWFLNLRNRIATWLAVLADKLEGSGSSWEWLKHHSLSIGYGAFSILCAIYAALWIISIFFNGIIGAIICIICAVMYAAFALMFWVEAEKAWDAAEMYAPTNRRQRRAMAKAAMTEPAAA
jgi:hypothetical protein